MGNSGYKMYPIMIRTYRNISCQILKKTSRTFNFRRKYDYVVQSQLENQFSGDL